MIGVVQDEGMYEHREVSLLAVFDSQKKADAYVQLLEDENRRHVRKGYPYNARCFYPTGEVPLNPTSLGENE